MRITIFALGSRGDVQPYLALGVGLRRAGHEVRLASHENFGTAARGAGLDFRPLRGDVRALMEQPELRALLDRGDFLAIQRHAAAAAREAAPHWAREGLAAARDAELVLTGLGGLNVARAVAEKRRLPLIEAHVVPLTPTRAFPAPLVPAFVGRLGGAANRASYRFARQAVALGTRAGAAELRGELGLPRRARPTPGLPPAPLLYGISPAVLPRPRDWPGHVHLTGFWFLPEEDWTPPPGVRAFLDGGPPPVALGFGSMGLRDPAATTALVLDALARTGARAVLLGGWGGLARGDLPPHVFAASALPHSWLFPRVAAAVHHGGAGTTAAALRAGVPGVVVPFFGDQPFWGERVRVLGAGPAPLPQRRLTAGALAAALLRARETGMRERAAHLGRQIRAEDGLAGATRLIGAYGRALGYR